MTYDTKKVIWPGFEPRTARKRDAAAAAPSSFLSGNLRGQVLENLTNLRWLLKMDLIEKNTQEQQLELELA